MNGKEMEPEGINNTEEHLREEQDESELLKTKNKGNVYTLGKSENFLMKIRGY